MQLTDLVTTFDAVRATRSRKAKIAAVAECLRQAGDDVFVVATYLSGALTQRRTGVGWRSLSDLPAPASEPSLTVAAVDAAFDAIAGASGAGSKAERRRLLDELFGAATEPEQKLLGWLDHRGDPHGCAGRRAGRRHRGGVRDSRTAWCGGR